MWWLEVGASRNMFNFMFRQNALFSRKLECLACLTAIGVRWNSHYKSEKGCFHSHIKTMLTYPSSYDPFIQKKNNNVQYYPISHIKAYLTHFVSIKNGRSLVLFDSSIVRLINVNLQISGNEMKTIAFG